MQPQYTTFYIARHGQTTANLNEIINAHLDSPLTEQGLAQAKKLGENVKDIKFDLAFSSDLMRAKRTAEIALLDRKMAVTATELLREKGYGEYDGRTAEEYRTELKKELEEFERLSSDEKLDYRHTPQFETYGESAERLIRFIRETALAYPGKTIFVATHGSILRGFLIKIGHATYEQLPAGSFPNGAHIKLECDGIDFFIKDTVGVNKKTE